MAGRKPIEMTDNGPREFGFGKKNIWYEGNKNVSTSARHGGKATKSGDEGDELKIRDVTGTQVRQGTTASPMSER
jgi:hypothetical protein